MAELSKCVSQLSDLFLSLTVGFPEDLLLCLLLLYLGVLLKQRLLQLLLLFDELFSFG